ncbi:MAG: PDZ domain-containing protein [Bacteroidota bacterium]
MIHYTFYQKNPASHYIYIDMLVNDLQEDTVQLQLPAWRPGRYELGNFAKNIKRLDVWNDKGEVLPYQKLSKDLWEVQSLGNKSIKITYSYYAAELNAGACYADEQQLYVNPVHTCLSLLGRENESHQIQLNIPSNYKIASSLKQQNQLLIAEDFEELVDSPFMASPALQSDYYEVNNIKFWLHFIGECQPDWDKFKKDFSAFTTQQIKFWGDFPYDEFHFLFQVLPVKFYHGVEHKKSTVIAIGPGYQLNHGETYESVLGVSCHELFHVWNIKTIRPVEMMPYNYTKENYARTGYVYEGFTTYYGDKLLLSSTVFNEQDYFLTLNERLQKHFHNYGRYNLSVAQSSWDTWLDGYVPGAPYRKTNIYDEGNLIALILDAKILEATQNKKSLKDVCQLLYARFGKTAKGYTERDIMDCLHEASGINMEDFFKQYVYEAADYEVPLNEAFNYLGLSLVKNPSTHINENNFGFKFIDNLGFAKIALVAPYSPAWKAGLFQGDDIIAVNGHLIRNNLQHWLTYYQNNESIELTVNKAELLQTIQLKKDSKNQTYFFNPLVKINAEASAEQNANFNAWKNS